MAKHQRINRVFTNNLRGMVPPPGIPTGRFLKDNCTWATSGGSANVSEAEIDFGAGAHDSTFVIDNAEVTTSSKILCNLAIKSPSDGRSVDEIVWESEVMQITPQANNGSVKFHVKNRLSGLFLGKFVINYLIG
jgi:hypothetical protein